MSKITCWHPHGSAPDADVALPKSDWKKAPRAALGDAVMLRVQQCKQLSALRLSNSVSGKASGTPWMGGG